MAVSVNRLVLSSDPNPTFHKKAELTLIVFLTRPCLEETSLSSTNRFSPCSDPVHQVDSCPPHQIMMMMFPSIVHFIVNSGFAVRGVRKGCSGLSAEES